MAPMYLDRKPVVGDYVERTKEYCRTMRKGSIWKITTTNRSNTSIAVENQEGNWDESNFKVINPEHPSHPEYKEQPMPTQQDIKVGSHWERIKSNGSFIKGEIITVESTNRSIIFFNNVRDLTISNFLERFKPRPDLDTAERKTTLCTVTFTDKVETTRTKFEYDHYTLAVNPDFFNSLSTVDRLAMIKHELLHILVSYNVPKKSWTQEQLEKIQKFCNNTIDEWSTQWDTQQPSTHLENFTIPWYEDVVNTVKPKPVAQQEPIQLTTKETFMSKIKDTALTTVGQNKQALVIASKMEAGRIINKQVLKQLKPHLPFFLQGYASSPFAPFIAANLVAVVANHTQNSKLLKVSDLMLLGAADSGVASFNLNDIIEDILSKIKLPAGALDDSDDE